ncbi:MAG: hypothetical protein ACLQQ4_12665 [Bacteroidia bacterium]
MADNKANLKLTKVELENTEVFFEISRNDKKIGTLTISKYYDIRPILLNFRELGYKVKKIYEGETPQIAEKVRKVNNFERDFSRIMFHGKYFPKGRIPLEIIKQDQVTNNYSSAELKKKWNNYPGISQNFIVLTEKNEALAINIKDGKKRYFTRDEQIIKCGSRLLCITNQWSSKRLTPFLEYAKTQGYVVGTKK